MARKKARPRKTARRRAEPKERAPQSASAAPFLDRRIAEGAMRKFLTKALTDDDSLDQLGKAQDLIYRAFESSDPEEQIKRAKSALELLDECADAYVVLAENAERRQDALEYYEKAVAAGERALGDRVFQNDVGQFWGLLETRPYMRAREGLAHTLWSVSRSDEAAEHLVDMLRLNPNDNQGVRYTLASWLLDLDRHDELAELLQRYTEDTANWAYTRALLALSSTATRPKAVSC
jgi:tetratricopeptide (TPR) repeat protein